MSWFARSFANTINLDDDDEDEIEDHSINETNKNIDDSQNKNEEAQIHDSPSSSGRGVKEDLSDLTKTLSRQFWGVASFLAPPPSSDSSPPSVTDPQESDPTRISGIRSDFAEIGGKFRSGISKLSNNMAAVSEITKMASNFLQLGSDEEGDYDSARGAVGVTDEVVAFVSDIALHPNTWLDFPLPENEDDEEFHMSDAQQEHALAVERLAPRLAALRMELCPGYMSDDCFWKIYFVLLHPKLDQHDAVVLSTPQIMEARAFLTHDPKKHAMANPEPDFSSGGTYSKDPTGSPVEEESINVPSAAQPVSLPIETSALESVSFPVAADVETEKHPILSSEIQVINKSVIEEGKLNENKDKSLHLGSSSNVLEKDDEDDADDWLKEENSEIVGSSGTTIPIDNGEDVSFSDLEEDEGDVPTIYKKETSNSNFSTKDSRDWVQLSRSSADSSRDINSVTTEHSGSGPVSTHPPESKESNDWLDVEDIDVA